MNTVAVLLAGGTGTRIGGALPKQLIEIGGRPLLDYSLTALSDHDAIDKVLIVMHREHLLVAERLVAVRGHTKVSAVCAGGAERADSTRIALELLGPDDDRLLIHDAARPFVTQRVIGECVAALDAHVAAATVMPSDDTVVLTEGGTLRPLPREQVRRYQTPQAFQTQTLTQAHEHALSEPEYTPTDDFSVVLHHRPESLVALVEGDKRTFKVTDPFDLEMAHAVAAHWDERTGSH